MMMMMMMTEVCVSQRCCVFQQSWSGHGRRHYGAASGAATRGDQQGAPASHEDGSVALAAVLLCHQGHLY